MNTLVVSVQVNDRLESVTKSVCLVLLQTDKVLLQPLVLAEAYCALQHHIPIITVFVQGGGYDYDEARQLLRNLSEDTALRQPLTELLEECDANILKPDGNGVPPTIAELQEALLAAIPSYISVQFHPSGSENALAGDCGMTLSFSSKGSPRGAEGHEGGRRRSTPKQNLIIICVNY